MTKPLIYVLAVALTLLVLSQLGIGIAVSGLYTAIVVAVIWGLVSLTIKPLLGLLTLPINIITFGLFSFVLNALLFWFVASFVEGFTVAGFIPALLGSVVISLVSSVINHLS
jgi:putative membrane protein